MFPKVHVFGVEHAISVTDNTNLAKITSELDELLKSGQIKKGDIIAVEGDLYAFLAAQHPLEKMHYFSGRLNAQQYFSKLYEHIIISGARLYFLTPERRFFTSDSANKSGVLVVNPAGNVELKRRLVLPNMRGIRYSQASEKKEVKDYKESLTSLAANISRLVGSDEVYSILAFAHYFGLGRLVESYKKSFFSILARAKEHGLASQAIADIDHMFEEAKNADPKELEEAIKATRYTTEEVKQVLTENMQYLISSAKRDVGGLRDSNIGLYKEIKFVRDEEITNNLEELLKREGIKRLKAVVVGYGHMNPVERFLRSKRAIPVAHNLSNRKEAINPFVLREARKSFIREKLGKARAERQGFKQWAQKHDVPRVYEHLKPK
ncbi:MAG: hypothetical protein PHH82_04535 [Candidatus ainarchaeum sp.]|nr:hypothetical protein [Candidatus ainarchaeum sp.]